MSEQGNKETVHDTQAVSSCCKSANTPTPTQTASSCCSSASVSACCAGATAPSCEQGELTHPSSSCSAESESSCCAPTAKKRIDWLLWGSLPIVVIGYALALWDGHQQTLPPWLHTLSHTAFDMVNAMWWGVLLAALFVGILNRVPREAIMAVLGKGGTKRGLVRATLAGLVLDLCNHGILMIAMKLYERGASIGQVMAFLIASPWNSLTLTLILVGLIGLPWTLVFIAGSLVVALLSGWLFDRFVDRGLLPKNPYATDLKAMPFWPSIKQSMHQYDWTLQAWVQLFWQGLKDSRMVLRWILFGVVLVALIRIALPEDSFELWFGATLAGLGLTLLAATVIEVCSEGASPIAADLVTRAQAPGNGFTFLMAGAATDYTEIMSLRDTTRSWKIALFLPLITVPQVLVLAWLMNQA